MKNCKSCNYFKLDDGKKSGNCECEERFKNAKSYTPIKRRFCSSAACKYHKSSEDNKDMNDKETCKKINDIFKEKFCDFAGSQKIIYDQSKCILFFNATRKLIEKSNSALCISHIDPKIGDRYGIKKEYLDYFISISIDNKLNISECYDVEGNRYLKIVVDCNKII